ncbi:MAG: bifunctional folylpolyglutamate synthase/dihydrofolate synthase [Clostridiales bacterium]|nr:bifunctional folylpolyglutamate synthase/dihydrofolate synthase [Clostridiales bacterium]
MPDDKVPEVLTGALQFGIKPGLERITCLMNLLGNPQDSFRSVHIAGTNGKGSVATFISSIMAADGKKTGVFTSPYLERFSERIRILDGKKGLKEFAEDDRTGEISSDDLDRYSDMVKQARDKMISEGLCDEPTEFELITAICFLYFADQKINVAVLETGLGGRLDSTNIVSDPLVTVITAIGLDHCGVLGNTVAEITGEKAGIFKEGSPCVCFEPSLMILPEDMKSDVRDTLLCKAREKKTDITFAGTKESFKSARFTMDGMMEFTYDGTTYKTALNGRHQIGNAITSIEACRKCGVSEDAIREGIALARWKSRAEILSIDPTVIIDGGHNPQGARSLGETMNEMLGGSLRGKPVRLLMGVMADKDVSGILEAYKACGLNIRSAVTVKPDNPRSEPADVLAQKINYVYNISDDLTACQNAEEGAKLAYEKSVSDGMILLATGSLYLTGQIRATLKGLIECTTI